KLFPGDEAEDIMKNIESMPIPKAASIRPGLPSRLDEILAGPLARKPIDRPGRPAIVLRQLIELSYESSIMATAMDVSEAVASVLPAKRLEGPGQQLDDVIRRQLGAAERERSVARRTAITDGKPPPTHTHDKLDHSTGMIRRIGLDGLSQLEEIEVDPTAVAAPRAKRASESGAVKALGGPSSPDSALHELLDANFDPDRRTEPGGPPTGQVPKSDGTAAVPKTATKTSSTRSSRTGLWVVIALVVLAGGGFGVWKLMQKPTTNVVTPTAKDAGTGIHLGIVEIDPDPDGATGYIADEAGTIAVDGKFGPTSHKKPLRLRVEAGKLFKVHIDREGYESYDTQRTINAAETVVIAPRLNKAKAALKVTTTPDGAEVAFKGKLLGETPLSRTDLEDAKGELVITKAGFDTYKQKIELVAGKTVEITQTLKAAAKLGSLHIRLKGGGWGDIYLNGAMLGRAPTREPLRVPIGKQTFQLVNSGNASKKIKWTVTCEVSATETNTCTTQMP
ncbi:MAG TPA: PEGA domain-containing protein, partial [Kofleriaceae bacterium]|nr:PEGA domain-containing protein [Kofleriaceae bacterium]